MLTGDNFLHNHIAMRNLKKQIRWPAIAVLSIILIFKSCDFSYLDAFDNMDDYYYEATFAIPLVDSKLSINDIIDPDGIGAIETDDENLIWLVYKGRVFSIPAEEVFVFPDQYQSFSVEVNPPAKSEIVIERGFLLLFSEDQYIEQISFRRGEFNVMVENAEQLIADGYNLTAQFEIINSETQNGGLISGTATPSQPASINLMGSSIDLGNNANLFLVKFTITVTGNGNPANAPYNISINQSMENIRYQSVYGYIGDITFPVGNTEVGIDIFKNANIADIFFENPIIEIITRSSFGTPIELNFTEFYAINRDDETMPIENETVTHWSINMPESLGETAVTNLELNRSNTNIDEIMTIRPTGIYYNVIGTTNPARNQSPNFINFDSNLSIDVEVNLPLFGRVDFFELQDTIGNTLEDLPEDATVEWLELKIQIENGFPFTASIDVFFLDENMQVYDRLFSEPTPLNVIESAPTDPGTNIVTQPTTKETLIYLDENKIQGMRDAKSLLLNVQFNTYNQEEGESVKILDTYELGVRMGVRAKIKAELSGVDED
jgi:hypothetical protein